jgi:hypothetical protein
MPSLIREHRGSFGEMIAAMELSRAEKRKYSRTLFRAIYLGDKHPVTDYLVEALGPDSDVPGFFLAQVRSTMREPLSSSRLPIDMDVANYNRLARLCMPTYLIGVDLRAERAFIVAAKMPRKARVSSISAAFDLGDDSVKIKLYEEVCAHWRKYGVAEFHSELSDA